jgi:hypothetical protein
LWPAVGARTALQARRGSMARANAAGSDSSFLLLVT